MTHFAAELATQPATWREAQAFAGQARAALPPDGAHAVILGCGTSLYVAQAVAAHRERQGFGPTDAFPASEVPADRTWAGAIVVSRSGTTTELIDAVRSLRAGTSVFGLVAAAGSPLAELLTDELDLPLADERSIVQTRFATTVLSLLLGAYGWDVDASAARAERFLGEPLPGWAGGVRQFVFLGRGVAAALANEAALKFREILGAWSEAYPTMEFRHGPISALGPESLVWILDAQEPSIDEQIEATGARLRRSEEGDPLAELVRIHRFAEGLAELRGINPDEPPHLTRSVVLTEN